MVGPQHGWVTANNIQLSPRACYIRGPTKKGLHERIFISVPFTRWKYLVLGCNEYIFLFVIVRFSCRSSDEYLLCSESLVLTNLMLYCICFWGNASNTGKK